MQYNVSGKEDGIDPKDRIETQGQETTEGSEGNDVQKDVSEGKRNQKRYVYPIVFLILAMNIIAISQR